MESRKRFDTRKRATSKDLSDDSSVKSKNIYTEYVKLDTSICFCLFFLSHIISALLNNINDCDETFNYWEPAHFLLYGNGFQTWEYSPKFAIRSYAYLWLYIMPTKFFSYFISSKVIIFYLTRVYITAICSIAETYFYRSIIGTFNARIALYYLFITIFSPGIFISASSFLPSSFGLIITCLVFGSWFRMSYKYFIFYTAFGTILGWPFTVALSIPMALSLLVNTKHVWNFIFYSFIFGIIILLPSLIVDYFYYGKFVFASLNILLYNVFSSHGPDLYGTEPLSYYFINLFLNFNLAFMILWLAIPVLAIIYFKIPMFKNEIVKQLFPMFSLFLWFFVFFSQHHKEERFMFPVYPLICLVTSFVLNNLQEICHVITPKIQRLSNITVKIFFIIFVLMSLSRICALYKGYNASLTIYHKLESIQEHLESNQNETVLCLGKEWHRFPSNFFILENMRVEFIQSEFRGQLPKHFDNSIEYPTRTVPLNMNDANIEEISRYINVSLCDFIIDSDYPTYSERDPAYSKDKENWSVVKSKKFLDNNRSSRLLRAFYIPYLYEKECSFINYNLLKNLNRNQVV